MLRFEVGGPEVEDAFQRSIKHITKQVTLPGFRAGKAPADVVVKQFEKEIENHTRSILVRECLKKALSEHKIDTVGEAEVEEISFARNQAFKFAATVETYPDFTLPDYRGLPAKREALRVTEEDVDKAIDLLRGQKAEFRAAERVSKEGDILIINYSGTCDGQPLTEIAPAAQGLTKKSNFWVAVKPDADSFIPGFTAQLVGTQKGDKRTVEVDFPADFVAPQLAGRHGTYEVEVVEVRERVVPALDDTLAKAYGAESVEHLRRGVRQDLQNELNSRQRRSLRQQIVRALLERVQFDVPESLLSNETRHVVYDIVHENQKRGVAKEIIDQNKDEIYSAANQTANERVKLGFLVHRIAEQEGIRSSDAEFQARIVTLAQGYNMSPKNFLRELQSRNGLSEVYQQIVHEKVLDFLQEHARIEEVPAGSLQAKE